MQITRMGMKGVVPRVQEFRLIHTQQCNDGAYLPIILLIFKDYNKDNRN